MTKLTKIESELDVYDDDDDDGGNEKLNFFNENFEANYPSYGGILDLNVRHRHTLSLSLSLPLSLSFSLSRTLHSFSVSLEIFLPPYSLTLMLLLQ